ncbi:P-II family nitrogen regulator [Microvirga guangxiensis]|uniref:Nitrogen regulatory protein P-II n=1 Tax=Microvirga guangxiensis TaxID=549386 RepID=A0A1G5KAF0_9HYPH|nr:P-II family nitrogen regulator [Microvirga guangxiensis]SCY97576.1 nitrogen regulatory protein P-II family [Microvirga guangxiensis]
MLSSTMIVTIVRKGWGNTALEASVKAGATGGTILSGRGVGVNEKDSIFGIPIEPEKEILLTLTPGSQADAILQRIVEAVELDKPGNGLAFVVPIENIVGVHHMASQAP